MIDLKDKRVIVTGANSMVGKSIRDHLINRGAHPYSVYHEDCDLMNLQGTRNLFNVVKPDYCFHLASYNGNIKFNENYPCDIFYRTAQIGMNVLSACVEAKVKATCSLISSCAYPPELPLVETNFFKGKPHDSVEGHGFAKKMLVEYGRQIKKQHGMDCINICVNHVYGPHDSFNPNKTKVVGSLIAKMSEAKKNGDKFVELWGDGSARREFIYVDDVGKYIPYAFERYDDSFEILNIGCGEDVPIWVLADIIREHVGFEGYIKWNGANGGQERKLLSVDKMHGLFGDLDFVSLDAGIKQTVEWYNENILCPSN